MEQLLNDLQKLGIPNPPNSVEELMQIEGLDLSNKKICSLPDAICNLTNLKKLNLSCNEIEWLPRDFGKLKNLTKLGLCENPRLRGIDEIADLENLQWLNISGSKNFQIPSLEKLQNLKDLYMRNTDAYENDIPLILEAKNLEVLDIGVNIFHNIDGLDGLRQLKYIVFDRDNGYLVPDWLQNDNWRYKIEAVQYFYSVYIFTKIIGGRK